jgi:hypothetical protein
MSSVDIQSILSSLTLEEKVCPTYMSALSFVRQLTVSTYRFHFLLERTFGRQSLYPQRVSPMSRLPMALMAPGELPLLAAQVLLASLLLV